MDYIRIKSISQSDFDGIVTAAGGFRIDLQAAETTADYKLNEAVIELKLIEEEGFEKASRQAKLAALFKAQQPSRPVVVLDPEALDPAQSRNYYNIVAGPIKTQVKSAAKQLDATARRYSPSPTRVLVITNLGYTALTGDEFASVCLKCVRNDTTRIDFLICAGIYFHSDKFENYLISRFEPHPINLNRPFPSFEALQSAWDSFTNHLATSIIKDRLPQGQGRLPVIDLVFDFDCVRYVKPAPVVPSRIFPGGRAPRTSSELESCPPVGIAFPALSRQDWIELKRALPWIRTLKASHAEFVAFQQKEDAAESTTLKPLVPVPVTLKAFQAATQKPLRNCNFSDLSRFAAKVLDQRVRAVLECTRERKGAAVLPPEYLHVIVQEIGSDEANDLASLYHVHEIPGFEREDPIFENERIFLNYALAVASSYAVKRRLDHVLFSKVRRCY